MRVKIYQINPERDNNRMKFMSLNDSQSPDPSIYDEVFDAETDENELEEIYGRFNTVGHPLFRGHSLSVSDVVVANGKASILLGRTERTSKKANPSSCTTECSATRKARTETPKSSLRKQQ